MKEVIKLAIEKGAYDVSGKRPIEWPKEITLLDPNFWQALELAVDLSVPIQEIETIRGVVKKRITTQPVWLYYWHRFIDHIAQGKVIDDFFKELLAERRAA